jgi:hypothetical protein
MTIDNSFDLPVKALYMDIIHSIRNTFYDTDSKSDTINNGVKLPKLPETSSKC